MVTHTQQQLIMEIISLSLLFIGITIGDEILKRKNQSKHEAKRMKEEG